MITSSGTDEDSHTDPDRAEKTQADHETITMNSFKGYMNLESKTNGEKEDANSDSLVFGSDNHVHTHTSPGGIETDHRDFMIEDTNGSLFNDKQTLDDSDTQVDTSTISEDDPFAITRRVEHANGTNETEPLRRRLGSVAAISSPLTAVNETSHMSIEPATQVIRDTQPLRADETQTQKVENSEGVIFQQLIDHIVLRKPALSDFNSLSITRDSQLLSDDISKIGICSPRASEANTDYPELKEMNSTIEIHKSQLINDNQNYSQLNGPRDDNQTLPDTQSIHNTQNMPSTQIISANGHLESSTEDTQKIDTQNAPSGLQELHTSRARRITINNTNQKSTLEDNDIDLDLADTQMLGETQKLEYTQKLENTETLDHRLADTQFIPRLTQEPSQTESESQHLSQSIFTKSHRQVMNTQEEYEVQNAEEDPQEVIKTDEEDEIGTGLDDTMLGSRYEDSLFQHKIKRRKLNAGPLDVTPHLSEQISKQDDALMNPKKQEVVASSPVVGLYAPSHSPPRSSPLKEFDRSIRSDKQDNNGDIEMRDESSSPSSEIDDIDEDYQETSSSEIHITNENIIHTVKRKSTYVIDSQSQNPRSDLTIPDGEDAEAELPEVLTPLLSENSSALEESDIKNEDSVWAIYNLKMYTGKIMHRGAECSTIEFLEGLYEIKNNDIFLLDIRVGDIIRIRSSTYTYVVTGLSNMEDCEMSCVRGYNYVSVKRHNSLRSAKSKSKEIGVPLSECFMELDQWVLHQSLYKLVIRGQDLHQQDTKKQNYESFVASKQTTFQPTLSILKVRSGCFNKMLFCITSIEGSKKEHIRKLIENNGGVLVDDDWNDLFSYETTATGLSLSAPLADYTFGGMISNNHCRSAKYLQALALGWPILADAFITACIENPSSIADWHIYLLPAGHSLALNAIKSLDIYNFRLNFDNHLDLSHQMKNNCQLLKGYHILVLKQKSNATLLETCRFIFHCFGASSLTYCTKTSEVVAAAVEELKDSETILVYDDGDVFKKMKKTGKKVSVINWEWVVQCVISGYAWDPEQQSVE